MNKATHRGTCQWCGRVQMLPDGVLAKHGYTTKWGFFSGTCRGAEEEPFELSCELVKKSIGWARDQRDEMVRLVEKLEAPATGNTAWVHERVQKGRHSVYEWHEVKVEMGDFGGNYAMPYFTAASGQKQWALTYGGGRTVQSMVQCLNKQRADAVRYDIRHVDSYIALQQERVNNWKPAPLMPVKEN